MSLHKAMKAVKANDAAWTTKNRPLIAEAIANCDDYEVLREVSRVLREGVASSPGASLWKPKRDATQ